MGFLDPRAVHGQKFKIPLPRSFVSGPIEYTWQVLSTSAQRSRRLRVLKMLTPYGPTDGHLTSFGCTAMRSAAGQGQPSVQ